MTSDAVEVRFAREADGAQVSSLLVEAATWAASRGAPIWPLEELGVDALLPEVVAGRFVLAMAGEDAVGTARLTREDPAIWPDAEAGVAVYVHRIAIRRRWAGRGLPGRILAWCEGRARELGCGYLRLDCDAARPKLCRLYEGLGFRFHSERAVGRYTVVRHERAIP